jgi:hypothetical protein
MALAQADAGDEHHVGVFGHEVQVEEVLDLRPVDFGGPVPVECVDCLEHGEAGLADAALHAPVLAGGGLAVEQFGEVVQVRPVLVGSRVRQLSVSLQGVTFDLSCCHQLVDLTAGRPYLTARAGTHMTFESHQGGRSSFVPIIWLNLAFDLFNLAPSAQQSWRLPRWVISTRSLTS